ncbi:hypothetical protein [Actinoallomurus sp. NPDC050550]|uniref:hypothetical protein n=1 Tax=Actinoallomurus sp. NPDC050550 TaxID=3154937 RepID=UPI0033FB75F6
MRDDTPAGAAIEPAETAFRGGRDMAALWEALITTGGSAGAAIAGLFIGGAVGRRGQSWQWLRDTRTAAYGDFLKQCSRLEIELREAYLAQRDNEADWDAVLATQVAVSLVADPETALAAVALTDALNAMASLSDGPRPDDHDDFRRALEAIATDQIAFVNAARRSLDVSQAPLNRLLGGPPAWHEIKPYLTNGTTPIPNRRKGKNLPTPARQD